MYHRAWNIAVVVLTMSSSSAWSIGPSFDCSKAQTPGQQLICSSPDLSRTDMAYAQAYYALRQQIGETGWHSLKMEAIAAENRDLELCGVPASGPLPPDTVAIAKCLKQTYDHQRTIWISRLTGPAIEEATRPVEQHVALQKRLQALNFLPADAVLDGVYGSMTRDAISTWQRANNRPETGFLSTGDADLLMTTGRSESDVIASTPSAPGAPASVRETESILAQWSGNTMMTTRPFHIEGSWELQWTSSGGYFSIDLIKLDGGSETVANQTDPGSSSSYVPDGGDYYLKVTARTPWTIKGVDIRPMPASRTTDIVGSGNNIARSVDPPAASHATAIQTYDGTPPKALSKMPEDEEAIIRIVDGAMTQYKTGRNEMQQGAARPMRAQSICNVLPTRHATNWVGTVEKLSTNGDGKGILYVQIAPDINVETTNNALSDVLSKTLIDPQTNLFRSVSQLHEGQKVRFSGTFIASGTDCIEETSMTLEGSITAPDFTFRFESVTATD